MRASRVFEEHADSDHASRSGGGRQVEPGDEHGSPAKRVGRAIYYSGGNVVASMLFFTSGW